MDHEPNGDDRTGMGPVKMEAAALALGAPIFVVAAVLLAEGPARLGALVLYGIGAGGWIAWRAGRAGGHVRSRAG